MFGKVIARVKAVFEDGLASPYYDGQAQARVAAAQAEWVRVQYAHARSQFVADCLAIQESGTPPEFRIPSYQRGVKAVGPDDVPPHLVSKEG